MEDKKRMYYVLQGVRSLESGCGNMFIVDRFEDEQEAINKANSIKDDIQGWCGIDKNHNLFTEVIPGFQPTDCDDDWLVELDEDYDYSEEAKRV